jgi:hypothetical protein
LFFESLPKPVALASLGHEAPGLDQRRRELLGNHSGGAVVSYGAKPGPGSSSNPGSGSLNVVGQ